MEEGEGHPLSRQVLEKRKRHECSKKNEENQGKPGTGTSGIKHTEGKINGLSRGKEHLCNIAETIRTDVIKIQNKLRLLKGKAMTTFGFQLEKTAGWNHKTL